MGIKFTIIILFITNLYSTTLNNLLNSNLPLGTKIEEIKYPNGKITYEIIKDKKKEFYSIHKNSVIFKRFKKIKSKYGNIYLFDLSKKEAFFNGLLFDYILINGNIKSVAKIGIADKNLFIKDDNLLLPLKKTISLNSIFKRVDLNRLKYFVIISKEEKNPINSIKFIKIKTYKNFTNNISLWIWNAKNLKKKKITNYLTNSVYIQISSNFNSAISKLKDTNVTIYGLNGSPKAIFNAKPLLLDIKKLATLKVKYPNIKGYQVDIEPYLLKNFKKNRVNLLKKYITLLKILKKETNKYNLKLSVVIPFWFDNIFIENKNLAFSVIDIADETAVMSYRSNIYKVINLSLNILKYASFANKDIKIGLECMSIKDEKHTIFSIENIDKKYIKKLREFTIKGKSISFYNQMYKLKELPYIDTKEISFKGFILHYYTILPNIAPF